ncbi:hypothetical protein UFOVP1049_53 [uncultured Caudovirales phage]|uniref:Uncharacterized protein n=1 Tax=uncultured Caudovirales phage TaxID=2100421 RepID=A0A6J5QHW3_9CAUD|nr:hypothetical protein UFOVP1049_53 [uncultured Caudovirales phage]
MTCCDYGKCTNGPDCPVRQKRLKEINDAYANGYNDAQLGDPIEDIADTFKALVALIALVLGVFVICLAFWGK